MRNIDTLTPIKGEEFRNLLRANYGDDSNVTGRYVVTDDLNLEEIESMKAVHSLVSVQGSLNLNGSYIKSFPNLEYAQHIFMADSFVMEFPKLEYVAREFWADNSKLTSLPMLRTVGNDFQLNETEIASLPLLESASTLNINDSKVQHLPALKKLDALEANNSIIKTIPRLELIDGYCHVKNSMLESMPKLKAINCEFIYTGTNFKDLSNLTSVDEKPFKFAP